MKKALALPAAAAAMLILAGCGGSNTAATPAGVSVNNDGLAGIAGWEPPAQVCGTANLMPVIIYNGTDEAQTASMTIGSGLTEQVIPSPNTDDYVENCPARTGTGEWGQYKSGFSGEQTVQPGEAYQFYLYLGGADYNLIEAGHQFSIGGLPNGAPNASWYDFDLGLNLDGGFESLGSVYSGTGGVEWASNGQNGFNIVKCNPSSFPAPGTGAQPSRFVPEMDTLLTPFSRGNEQGPAYGWWEPMCLAWFPNATPEGVEDLLEDVEKDLDKAISNDPSIPASEVAGDEAEANKAVEDAAFFEANEDSIRREGEPLRP